MSMQASRRYHARMLVRRLRILVTGRYGRNGTLDDEKRRITVEYIKHAAKGVIFGGRR